MTDLRVVPFTKKEAVVETNKDLILKHLSDYVEAIKNGTAPEPDYLVMFTDTSRWAIGIDPSEEAYVGLLEMEKMFFFLNLIDWEEVE